MNKESYTQDTLSIRLSADGFSFSVTNSINKASFRYESLLIQPNISLTANIKQVILPHELLQKQFKEIKILLNTPNYTIVPFELFEDEQAETIYYQCHPKRPGETILYNILDRCNIVIIFAIEKSTHTLLQELFSKARIYASISPLIEHLANKSRIGGNYKTYIHLRQKNTDILVFKHGQPLLINTFATLSNNDRIYYILNIWEKLALNQEHDELYIVGNHIHTEQIANDLGTYIKSVSIINPIAEFNRSTAANNENIPYDLLTLLHTNF